VVLARSGVTLEIGPGQSIADVLDARGVFVPTSCRQGVCGSCETRVCAGRIDHRDSILSEAEKERGDTMMVCVSRARDDRLTLDL
jgi:ferredoxin